MGCGTAAQTVLRGMSSGEEKKSFGSMEVRGCEVAWAR